MNWDTSGNKQAVNYGGFWRRSAALLIDLFIIKFLDLILIGTGIWAAGKALRDLNIAAPSEDLVFLLIGLFILTGIILFISYFLYFNLTGQTPGKKFLGLKIISQSEGPIRFLQAALRSFGLFISCFFFFMGFLLVPFNKKKLSFHDLLAGTYVIQV
ncbi:MAG: RDD family protein [Nitrospirae bacterium]|nr:RDD family protein [Nitrospirota bacterium]MBI3594910.1 RDD family protein [Nitrospirota bacterium]